MPTTRNPGIAQWIDFARTEGPHHDSLEGLLRQPLSITATADTTGYGNPRRGQLMYEHTDGTMRPFIAFDITSRVSDGVYKGEFYADVPLSTAVTVFADDGTTSATGTVSAVQYEQRDAYTGLVLQEGQITITWDVAEPATQDFVMFTAAAAQTLAGVVVESVMTQEFGLGVEIDGARPEKVAAGTSPWIDGLTGVTRRSGLLFIRTV